MGWPSSWPGLDRVVTTPVVTVLVKGLGIGGAEKLIVESARFWDRSAFDYRVLYLLPWKDQLVEELRALGVPVACIGSGRGLTPGTVMSLRRQLDQTSSRLVHAHLPSAGILARFASPGAVVYTEHNMVSSYRAATRLVNRLTYWRNDAITAVSPTVAEAVASYPGPEVEVVRNGVAVEVDSFEARRIVRGELGLPAGQPLVVHVGNIRPGKGHDLLVDVASRLQQRNSQAVVVSIGGEKRSGDLARLREQVSDKGLNGAIRFLGRRPDAAQFIAAADLYVNPAQVEGLPVTLLEAMALARPVVATAVGGVPDLIEHEVNGWVVPSGSSEKLAEVIEGLLGDVALRARLGEAARDTVLANYSLGHMVRAFERIYRRLLT